MAALLESSVTAAAPTCSLGLLLLSGVCALQCCCSWFILKDGKIFWFKTDIVGPVRKPCRLGAWFN